jgi:hypothetical protein
MFAFIEPLPREADGRIGESTAYDENTHSAKTFYYL